MSQSNQPSPPVVPVKPMTAEELKSFTEQELKNLDAQRLEVIRARGEYPFLESISEGDNFFTLLPFAPRDYRFQGKGDLRKLFIVKKQPDPDDKDHRFSWSVAANSPLYREAVEMLATAPCDFILTRTGTDRTNTRYSIRRPKK